MVSVHYQIPIYLFYTIGLTLAGLLWVMARPRKGVHHSLLWAGAFLSSLGLYGQAAMPLSSGLSGRVAGASTPSAPLGLQRAGLYVEPGDVRLYRHLVALIERETQLGDTILVLPSNAELYFLSQRRNPYRFYNSALGLRTAADLDSAVSLLECHPPRMVFFNPKDKYNTPNSERLIEFVRTAYDPLETVPPFEIFLRRNSAGTSAPGSCPRDKGD